MNLLRLLLSLLMISPALPILPKPHVGRIASLGRTVVHVLNTIPTEQDKLPQELSVTFDGIQSNDNGKPIAEHSFWPANGEQFTISSQQDVAVAEIARTLGIKAQSSYTMTETINLPGIGNVKLIQQISGTKLSSTMQIGLSAPQLGIDQQLFNDREWHTVTIAHVNETNEMIGEYRIHYCQHYFGSYLAGLMKGKKTDLQENLAVARRTVWNSLWLAAGAYTAIKVLPEFNEDAKKEIEYCNEMVKSEVAERVLDVNSDIQKALEMFEPPTNEAANVNTVNARVAEIKNNLLRDLDPKSKRYHEVTDLYKILYGNPDLTVEQNIESYKMDNYISDKYVALTKFLRLASAGATREECHVALGKSIFNTSAKALKLISNPILQSAFMLAGLYLVASKPMPYPNVIYIVEYSSASTQP